MGLLSERHFACDHHAQSFLLSSQFGRCGSIVVPGNQGLHHGRNVNLQCMPCQGFAQGDDRKASDSRRVWKKWECGLVQAGTVQAECSNAKTPVAC